MNVRTPFRRTPSTGARTTSPGLLARLGRAVPALALSGALAACGFGQEAVEPTAVVPPVAATEATDVEVVVPTAEGAGAVATTGPVVGQEPVAISLSDIADDPAQYLGQMVTIRAPLGEVLGPRSFTLSDPALLDFDALLVIGAAATTIPTEEGVFGTEAAERVENAEIEVTGMVRQFDQAALEQELSYTFPNPAIGSYGGQTAIVAESVAVLGAGTTQGTQPTAGAAQGGVAIPEAARGEFPFISVGQIDVNPETYVGQRVTAWGEVDAQLGPNTFRVDEGNITDLAGQVLVVVPEGAPRPDNLQNETSIAITGMVQQFVAADFERDYGVLFDDPGLEAEFESRPVLVADIVYTRASVSDIDDDAEAYIGNRVTVLGDITEQVDPRTFRLDDPALLGGDDILVFMGDENLSAAIGDEVFVTGEVREFNREALADEYGYTWDDALFDGFAENTIIVAENIQRTGPAEPAVGGTPGNPVVGDRFAEDEIGISDIAGDPEAYVGQQVTLNGEVSEVLGPNTVRMDEDNWLDIGDDVLVVLPEGVVQPTTLEDETNIVIQGTVRNFVLAEFERDYDFFTDSELYAEFENRPVVVAEMLWLQASLSDVDDNPDAYLGNRVTVFGEASELLSTSAFRLEDPGLFAGDDVLVLLRDQAATVAEGARYYVTGTVQRFNLTDVEAELGYDLDDALFADWGDRTVIIADTLQPRGQ